MSVYTITAPTGRWLRRLDEVPDKSVPILAYGMPDCVFIIWSNGSHTVGAVDMEFPRSNWEVWEL